MQPIPAKVVTFTTPHEAIVNTLVQSSEEVNADINDLLASQRRQQDEMMRLIDELQKEQSSLQSTLAQMESELDGLHVKQDLELADLNRRVDEACSSVLSAQKESEDLMQSLKTEESNYNALKEKEVYWNSPVGRSVRLKMRQARLEVSQAAEIARQQAVQQAYLTSQRSNPNQYTPEHGGGEGSRGSNW